MENSILLEKLFGDQKTRRIVHHLLEQLDILKHVMTLPLDILTTQIDIILSKKPKTIPLEFWSVPTHRIHEVIPCYRIEMKPVIDRLSFLRDDGLLLVSILDIVTIFTILMFGDWSNKVTLLFTWYNFNGQGLLEEEEHFLLIKRVSLLFKSLKLIGILDIPDDEAKYLALSARLKYDEKGVGMFLPGLFLNDFIEWTKTNEQCLMIVYFSQVLNRLCQMIGTLVHRSEKLTTMMKDIYEGKVEPVPACPSPAVPRFRSQSFFVNYYNHNLISVCLDTTTLRSARLYVNLQYEVSVTKSGSSYYTIDENIIDRNPDLYKPMFTPGLACCQKYYKKMKTAILHDPDVQLATNQPFQRVTIEGLEPEIQYTITIYSETTEFGPFSVKTHNPRRKTIIDSKKKLLIPSSFLTLEQFESSLVKILEDDNTLLAPGPILSLQEFFERMKSCLSAEFHSVETIRNFLLNFGKLFQLFIESHLNSKIIDLYRVLYTYNKNEIGPLFNIVDGKQVLFYFGHSLILSLEQQQYYFNTLGERNYSLLLYYLENIYYSYVKTLLPPKRELQFHSFNTYLITPATIFHPGQRDRATYSLKEIIEILQTKKQNPKIIPLVEKCLLFVIRHPLDLLLSARSEFNRWKDFVLGSLSDSISLSSSDSVSQINDQESPSREQTILKTEVSAPVLFGKYEIIHGEYSSNPNISQTTTTSPTILSDLFPIKSNVNQELFDLDFYNLVKSAILYTIAMMMDQQQSTTTSQSFYILEFIITDWMAGKDFDVYYEYENLELALRFRRVPSELKPEFTDSSEEMKRFQEESFDIFNRIEASLPQNVKIRILPDKSPRMHSPVGSQYILQLQRVGSSDINGSLIDLSAQVSQVPCFGFEPPKQEPFQIIEGPKVVKITTNELIVEAWISGHGIVYCTLYELPSAMNHDLFSTIMINYRDKFARRRIGKTQVRRGYGNKLLVHFSFLHLHPHSVYGIVLETEESLKFSSSKGEDLPLTSEATTSSYSNLTSDATAHIAVTKTLPSVYTTYLSNTILSPLSCNDYRHDTFRIVKLFSIYENLYRLSPKQLIGLVAQTGIIDSEDVNSEISTPQTSYRNNLLTNSFLQLFQRYHLTTQHPILPKLDYYQSGGYFPSKQQSFPHKQSTLFPNNIPQTQQVVLLPKLNGIQVKYDTIFCYIVPLYPTDECLQEITDFIWNNLYERKDIKILIVYNVKAVVDTFYHIHNSNDWFQENQNNSLLFSKKINRQFLEAVLTWKGQTGGEVKLMSVGLVPEITSIMIGFYTEGGIFFHKEEERGDDNRSINTFNSQQLRFDPAIAKLSQVVETSVVDRKHCIYLHIFPMYSYNPLALAEVREDSDEEEDEVDNEEENQQNEKIESPPSTFSQEQFLKFPSYEVKVTNNILYRLITTTEMKSSREILIQYKPLIRMYNKSKTIQFREPIVYHLSFVYNYKGIFHLFDPLRWDSNPQQPFSITTEDDNQSFHSSEVASFTQVDNLSSLYTKQSQDATGSNLKMIVKPVVNEVDYFEITFGPINGRVTSTEIRILFEFNMDLIELECSLIPTNQREEESVAQRNLFLSKRERIKKYNPVVFVFPNCIPDTLYNIFLPSLYPNKILGTVKTNPKVAMKTEVIFVGSHHYQNVPMKDLFLYQVQEYQSVNLYDLALLQNSSHEIQLIHPNNPHEIPSIFDLMDHNLIQSNQLDNILVFFHLDSLTFFTHYFEEMKRRCYELSKQYFQLLQLKEIQIEQERKEKEEEIQKIEAKFKKRIRGYKAGSGITEEVLKEIDQQIKEKRRNYDKELDDQLLNDYYLQQIVDIMTDTIRVIWSNPEVSKILSKSCHIPLFHTDYLLPNPVYSAADTSKRPDNAIDEEKEVLQFIRALFEKQVQLYVLELYGMDADRKNEIRVWELGPLLILLLDLASGRTKLKHPRSQSAFQGAEADEDDEEAGKDGKEAELKVVEEGNDENKKEDDEGNEDGDEIEAKDKEEDDPDQEKEDEVPIKQSTKKQKGKRKPTEDEEGEASENRSKFPFSPGFIEKNQWKTIRKLCVDDKITQLIIATEDPLIPLQEIPNEFNFNEIDERFGESGKIPKGQVIPFSPTVKDLETFFNYWIQWIAKIRNASNNIESRSVIFVSKSKIPYSTTIQDLKTGIKLHQVCVGNYGLHIATPSEPTSHPEEMKNEDDFVMKGKIGTIKYVHSLKGQDYVRMTAFETEAKRNLKNRIKLAAEGEAADGEGEIKFESDSQRLFSEQAKRKKQQQRESHIKSKKKGIKRTIIDAGRIDELTGGKDGLDDAENNGTFGAEDLLRGDTEQPLVSRRRQYPSNMQGNVGYAQLKMWLDRWNPIGVWTNVDMNTVNKHHDITSGGKKGAGAGALGSGGKSNLTMSQKRKQMIEDGRRNEGLGRDGLLDGKEGKGKGEDEEDEDELEEAILLFGPIIGAPIVVATTASLASATADEDNEEEEEAEVQRERRNVLQNDEGNLDPQTKYHQDLQMKKKKLRIKIPIMIETDRGTNLVILLTPLFTPRKQHEFHIGNIPPSRPYVFELGPLALEERYQVTILSGLKPSPYNSFILSTHNNWDETNVIVINCELPDLTTNNANPNLVIQPSPFLMVDLFQRCAIPFHGINCIIHNNFQPNFDSLIENNGYSYQLKSKLFSYQQTKKISNDLRTEMNLLFNLFRNGFRDQYSRPSFRELLRAGMNLLIPQYSSLNDYLQMNAPEVTAQKKNQRRKGKKKKLSPFMIALNQKKAEEAAKEEARKLNPSKMNGILLLQLIEQRVIQEYIDTLRYPSCNVYRAVIDTANDDQYADYQQHTLQFVKPNHRIQNELIDQFNQLYNVNYRAEINAAAAAAAAANKKTRKSLNVPRFSGFKSSAVIEVDLSYSKSDRFQLIWSDPVDDPVDAVLKQWAIAAIPAPTQWLPYYSINEKLSIESISLIHSYQVPESPVVAATEPEKPAEKAPSRTGYALELPKGPNYVSYHTKDFTNHRAINSIQALSKVDIQSYVRIVIANNKRFFSSLLSREQQNALNKSVFEALMKEKNILNLTNFLLTNLNSPERATRKNSVLIPTRRTSTANNAPATSVAAPPPAENTPAEAAPAPDTTPAAETTPTKNDTEEDKNAAAEEIDDTIPSMIINPHQQVMLQFTTLFTLLEEWKKQFFGRQYLLCLPIQFPSLGTRAEDLYCVTEQDINLMITNFENYEADATNKFSRRKSVVEFTTLLTENVPHFTTEIQKLSIYLIDSIYRSNEYERNTILSDRRLTIPKKKINLSQLKSKRAQKKKQEEEMKQMKQILAEIEEISTKQIADGYLLIQAQSMKVFTDVTRTSRDSKHASFFAKGDMNNTGEGVISPRGGRRKSIGNGGDEIAEKKEEGHISPFGSPREFLTGVMGSPRDKPETKAIEEVPSFVAVAPIHETVMDVITTVTIQIIGDKLMMQKQFEEQYPYTVSQSLPPTDSLKIVNPLFEEEYSNKKFDLLQLPNWFPFIFPIDETIFIEDEIWFIMKQQTKLSKLLELFEKMFAFLSSSSSTGTIVAANREGTADLVQSSSSSSNYYQVLYQQLLKEYELSRLYELSLPEDLREIDFNLSGNTAIFFKDFVTQLWYSRQKRVPSMNLILKEDGEKGEQNPSVGGVSQSNREGEGNGSSSGRRRSARESFVLSSEMRHYMLNLSDDFIRSFCFSKSFHQITFQNLLAVNTNPRDRGGEGGAGFATQEELIEYLAVNKEKFDNFYHHSPENVHSILSSRQLLMKATITALYYSMVMRMGRTIAINEKYSYLLQRKDRIARLLETIERIERKLFLQKLQEDKDLLSIEAADRVLEMIQDIPTNAKQKKARADKLKEKEKEEKAKAKAIAEGSAGAEKTAAEALPPTEKESRQYLIFITPQEEEDLIAQFNDQYEQQFNQELANIEYIPEEYDANDNPEQEEQELLSPRDKANLIKETDAMVRQQLQKRQEEQKEQRAKEIKVNNLMDLTAEELNEHEATMFQSISEEEVKALHAYRQKTALESSQPLLDKVMELILLDAIDQLTAQLIQENIVFPNYDLNEENRRTKAAVRVQRMTRQNQLQRRKYGKRITFLQFK